MPNSMFFSVVHDKKFSTDFLANDPGELSKSAKERLAIPVPGFDFSVNLELHNFPTDKWLLSSAVQKLIRRGLAERAVKTALTLHLLDPAYLPRRLPVIALEDVGIADLAVCFDTLHVFGTRRLSAKTSDLDQRQLLANLIYRLACSVKSRAACDILCLALADSSLLTTAAELMRSGAEYLIKLAADRKAADVARALALHLLSGMSVKKPGQYRPVSRFNGDALITVAEKLDLPPVIAWMLIKGRNTSGLAAMLPLVLEAVSDGAADLQIKHFCKSKSKVLAENPILGVPACAADMHTSIGRRAIAQYSEAVKQKHPRFFEAIQDGISHSKLFELAIFHLEGSKLNRWLECGTLAGYREQVERAELKTLGLSDPASHQQLYQILETECQLLWQIRKAHLSSAFYAGK